MLPMVSQLHYVPGAFGSKKCRGMQEVTGTSGHALLPLPPGSPGQGRPPRNQRKPGELFHGPRIPWWGLHPDLGVQVLGISLCFHVAVTVCPLQPPPDSSWSLPFLPPQGALSDPLRLFIDTSLFSSRGHLDLRVLWGTQDLGASR